MQHKMGVYAIGILTIFVLILSGCKTATTTVTITQTKPTQTTTQHTVTSSTTTTDTSLPLQITTSSLTAGTVDIAYSATLTATGGKAPYTWSVSGGTLPGGLSLSNTGVIQGTPKASGTYTFTIKAADSSTAVKNTTQLFSVTIIAGAVNLITTSLPDGTSGEAYSETLTASGGSGSGNYTWTKSSGTLPSGLALGSSTGILKGTPTTAGDFTFVIKVADTTTGATDTQSFTITIEAGEVKITTTSLSDGTTGESYSKTLVATGGSGDYTWSKSSGTLPPGLTLGSSTGILKGTPTTADDYTFTIKVKDDDTSETDTQSYTVTIESGEVAISTDSLPEGYAGESYSETLEASGGSDDYTWTKSSGTLPTGLTLGSSTGILKGIPTVSGEFTFTIKVKDNDTAETDTQSFTVTILAGEVRITTTSLSDGTVDEYYSKTLAAKYGSGDYYWSVYSGDLPDGLVLDYSDGTIIGTPTIAGDYTFVIQVDDNETGETDTQSFTVTIN